MDGCGEGVPSKVTGLHCMGLGYNLKLISTVRSTMTQPQKHHWEKKWGGRVHPSSPRGNALIVAYFRHPQNSKFMT